MSPPSASSPRHKSCLPRPFTLSTPSSVMSAGEEAYWRMRRIPVLRKHCSETRELLASAGEGNTCTRPLPPRERSALPVTPARGHGELRGNPRAPELTTPTPSCSNCASVTSRATEFQKKYNSESQLYSDAPNRSLSSDFRSFDEYSSRLNFRSTDNFRSDGNSPADDARFRRDDETANDESRSTSDTLYSMSLWSRPPVCHAATSATSVTPTSAPSSARSSDCSVCGALPPEEVQRFYDEIDEIRRARDLVVAAGVELPDPEGTVYAAYPAVGRASTSAPYDSPTPVSVETRDGAKRSARRLPLHPLCSLAHANRYTPTATRYTPTATRYTPTATRYTPTATRYTPTPTATRYTPTAATRYTPNGLPSTPHPVTRSTNTQTAIHLRLPSDDDITGHVSVLEDASKEVGVSMSMAGGVSGGVSSDISRWSLGGLGYCCVRDFGTQTFGQLYQLLGTRVPSSGYAFSSSPPRRGRDGIINATGNTLIRQVSSNSLRQANVVKTSHSYGITTDCVNGEKTATHLVTNRPDVQQQHHLASISLDVEPHDDTTDIPHVLAEWILDRNAIGTQTPKRESTRTPQRTPRHAHRMRGKASPRGDPTRVDMLQVMLHQVREMRSKAVNVHKSTEGVNTLHNDMPTSRKETPTFRKETPTFRKETPTFRKETPTFRKEKPTSKDVYASREETLTSPKNIHTSRKDIQTSHKDTSIYRKDTLTSHKDTPISHKDIQTSHKDTLTSHKDTPISRKDIHTSRKDIHTSRKDIHTSNNDTPTSRKDTYERRRLQLMFRSAVDPEVPVPDVISLSHVLPSSPSKTATTLQKTQILNQHRSLKVNETGTVKENCYTTPYNKPTNPTTIVSAVSPPPLSVPKQSDIRDSQKTVTLETSRSQPISGGKCCSCVCTCSANSTELLASDDTRYVIPGVVTQCTCYTGNHGYEGIPEYGLPPYRCPMCMADIAYRSLDQWFAEPTPASHPPNYCVSNYCDPDYGLDLRERTLREVIPGYGATDDRAHKHHVTRQRKPRPRRQVIDAKLLRKATRYANRMRSITRSMMIHAWMNVRNNTSRIDDYAEFEFLWW